MDIYERIFESTPEALLVTDDAGRIANANARTEDMFGYSRQELLGKPTEMLVPAELRPRHAEHLARFLNAPRVRPLGAATELQGQRKDGTRFPIDIRLDPIPAAEGTWVLATMHDISERKRAEEAGRRHEERIRAVFDAGLIGMSVTSPQLRFVEVNDALADMLGVPKNALVGRSWEDFTHPDDIPETLRFVDSALADERDSYRMEQRYIRADGSTIPLEIVARAVRNADRSVRCFVVLVQDIAQRKQAEAALRGSEARFRTLVEQASDGIFISDPSGRYLDVNAAGAEMSGFTREEVLASSIQDLLAPDEAYRIGPEVARLAGGEPGRSTWRFRRKDGTIFWGEVIARQLPDSRILAFVRDVTERRRVEEALRSSETNLKEAQELAKLGSWQLDLVNNRLQWSDEVYRIFETSPSEFGATYEHFMQYIHPDDRERVDRCYTDSVKDRAPYAIEHRLLMPDGGVKFVQERGKTDYDDNGVPVRSIGTVQDITERKSAETRLLANERRLRAISDNLPNCVVFEIDRRPDGAMRFFHISEQVEALTGVPVADVLRDTSSLLALIHPDDRLAIASALESSVAQPRTFDNVVRLTHRERGARWMRFTASPRRLDDGSVCWDGALNDVTKGYEANLRLRENEATLTAVIDSASDAMVSTDVDGRILRFNPAAERIFGWAASSLIGQSVDKLLPGPVRPTHRRAMQSFAASGVSSRAMSVGRVQGVRADGTLLELDSWISQVIAGDRHVLTAILRDVTERVHTERALMKYQLELTDLTHQLMAQEKATSTRLAQILHDQLGQTLTAIRIDFVSEAQLPDPRQAARHSRVDRLIDEAVRQVRQVLVELRPTLLDERGLIEAIDNELRARQAFAPDVLLRLEAPGELSGLRWSADVEYAAFMVAREAVANAQLHSGASLVRVVLTGDPRRLEMEIADDGKGLAADALAVRPGHLGIVGMRERSIAIGAQFEVRAAADGGTSVRLAWEGERS